MCIVFPCQGWNSLSYSLGLFFLGLECQFVKYPLGVENLYEQILVSFLVHAEYLPCIALRPLDLITKARFPIGPEHREEKGNIIALFFPSALLFAAASRLTLEKTTRKQRGDVTVSVTIPVGLKSFAPTWTGAEAEGRPRPGRLSSPARHLDNTQG